MRSSAETRDWLLDRKRLGIRGVSASFVGTNELHDRWSGRRGDFDYLLETLKVAADLGMKHGTNIFVTKSSISHIEELCGLLDALPTSHAGRHFRPFFFIGHGAHREAERIDESDRERLPDYCNSMLNDPVLPLRSEREWIHELRRAPPDPANLSLHIELTRQNIDRLEQMPCADLFHDIDFRARSTLAKLPSTIELLEICSDPRNTKLYGLYDLRRLWIERYVERMGVQINDRSLLHYYVGRSQRPPRLWDAKAPRVFNNA